MERDKILEDILSSAGILPEETMHLRDVVKSSEVYKAKSDMLFRFGLMNQLMFDMFGKYLDMFLVLADPSTHEVLSFTHACQAEGITDPWEMSEKTIDYLIPDLCISAMTGEDRKNADGETAANEVLTIMMNSVAKMCVESDDLMNHFHKFLEYWSDKKKEKEDKEENQHESLHTV